MSASVYFLGPENSFSHQASLNLFPSQKLLPAKTFSRILQNLANNKDTLGILPIENSITSNISENIDAIFSKNFFITAEVFLDINLHLFGLSGATLKNIKTVISHPKALSQASKFVQLNGFNTQDSDSTASAKDEVLRQNNPQVAFIGGESLYANNLIYLSKNVGNVSPNRTRFVVLTDYSNHQKYLFGETKTNFSVIFKIPHKPNSLAQTLTEFGKQNINLTKIESRPIAGTFFEYEFLVELAYPEGNLDNLKIILDGATKSYTIIGRF